MKIGKYGLEVIFSSRNMCFKTFRGSTKEPRYSKFPVKITKQFTSENPEGTWKRILESTSRKQSWQKQNATVFRSKVAERIVLNTHIVSRENVRLVKGVRDARKLDTAKVWKAMDTPGFST